MWDLQAKRMRLGGNFIVVVWAHDILKCSHRLCGNSTRLYARLKPCLCASSSEEVVPDNNIIPTIHHHLLPQHMTLVQTRVVHLLILHIARGAPL